MKKKLKKGYSKKSNIRIVKLLNIIKVNSCSSKTRKGLENYMIYEKLSYMINYLIKGERLK